MTRDPTTLTPEQLALQAQLFTKIKDVMAGIGELEKKGYNKSFRFHYVTHTDAKDAVRKGMVEHGIVFLPECPHTGVEPFSEKQTRSVSDFVVTLGDCDTGWTWSLDWQGEALDTQDKGFPKTVTLGLKYLQLALFLIAADEDDPDGADGSERTRAPRSSGQTLKGKVLDNPGDYKPTFTRYKGRTLSDITDENKGFPKWVLDTIQPESQDRADLLANCQAFVGMVDDAKSRSAQSGEHWTKTQDWKAFYVAAGNLGLGNADVHVALDVASAKAYKGSKQEAWTALVKFATETVEGWHAHEGLTKEWFKFLNALPAEKRPSPANAAAMIADIPGGTLADFGDTLAVAKNVIFGKLGLLE
jgi:hypothetical protein